MSIKDSTAAMGTSSCSPTETVYDHVPLESVNDREQLSHDHMHRTVAVVPNMSMFDDLQYELLLGPLMRNNKKKLEGPERGVCRSG